ncbi:hypothetical protein [Vibrio furnissii]|uniref:hypothetical protein n=1 Tax=Vibrio furnissii TaxID=29494 RepID=UPI001EE9DDE8|nr:hypothetical protein [Vibrio furnissii]
MLSYFEFREKVYRKEFGSPEFFKYLVWAYSGATAASFAFFLALFSAGNSIETSFCLKTSIFFFTVSLLVNMSATIVLIAGQSKTKYLYKLVNKTRFGWVLFIGVWTFIFAVIFLLFFYSIISTLVALLILWGCYKLHLGAHDYIDIDDYFDDNSDEK